MDLKLGKIQLWDSLDSTISWLVFFPLHFPPVSQAPPGVIEIHPLRGCRFKLKAGFKDKAHILAGT